MFIAVSMHEDIRAGKNDSKPAGCPAFEAIKTNSSGSQGRPHVWRYGPSFSSVSFLVPTLKNTLQSSGCGLKNSLKNSLPNLSPLRSPLPRLSQKGHVELQAGAHLWGAVELALRRTAGVP